MRVIPGRQAALDAALAHVPPGESLYIFAGYTPMRELRAGSCNGAAGCRRSGRSDAWNTPAPMTLRICHLYPRLLSVAGDRGNLFALTQRCAWRGIGRR